MPKTDLRFNAQILLVDDEEFIRRIIRQVLLSLGYNRIEEEEDGSDALFRMQYAMYDLILTDVQMPKTNGLELLKRIRCGMTKAPRDSRVLIITSFSNTEVLRTAIALDVNGFLVKPMAPAAVQQRIDTAMTENFYAKPVDSYQRINTDLASLWHESEQTAHEHNTVNVGITRSGVLGNASADKSVIEGSASVPIHRLKSGMEICKDIRLKDGTLILASNHTLSENSINRLHDLSPLLMSVSINVRNQTKEDES